MARMEEIAAKALEMFGNDRYKLTLAVAKRTEALANGATPLIEADKNKVKLSDIALMEIAENKLVIDTKVS